VQLFVQLAAGLPGPVSGKAIAPLSPNLRCAVWASYRFPLFTTHHPLFSPHCHAHNPSLPSPALPSGAAWRLLSITASVRHPPRSLPPAPLFAPCVLRLWALLRAQHLTFQLQQLASDLTASPAAGHTPFLRTPTI
jgi:hypothetical protein